MNVTATFALEAQQHLERGDAKTAIALCTKGLDKYPQYVTAYLVLARAFLATGDYDSADKVIEKGMYRAPRTKSFTALRSKTQSVPETSTAPEAGQDILRAVVEREVTMPSIEELSNDGAAPSTGIETAGLVAAAAFKTLTSEPEQSDRTSTLEKTNESLRTNTNPTSDPSLSDIADYALQQTIGGYLRVLGKPMHTNSLRSNNIRLIPGLEFTSLRLQSGLMDKRGLRSQFVLPEIPVAPIWEEIAPEYGSHSPATIFTIPAFRDSVTPEKLPDGDALTNEWEALAQKLTTVEMPPVSALTLDEDHHAPHPSVVAALDERSRIAPNLVSETMANIYVVQGAYTEALSAYQLLLEKSENPEKTEEYRQKIGYLQSMIEQPS